MKYLIVLFLVITRIGFAQTIRQQKMELPDGSKLTYQTINGKLNGIYSIDKEGRNLLRGNYVDEKRVGNWYLFNKDKSLFARYNYDVKKVVFLDDKMLALADIVVKGENEEINRKASVCFPLIPIEQYISIVTKLAESSIPAKDISKMNSTAVSIVAKVNDMGVAEYFVDYILNGKNQQYKLKVNREPFAIDWVTSSYEGKVYPSEFIIKVKLATSVAESQHRRFNWL